MVNNYTFHDEWKIKASLPKSWKAISKSTGWESWWPGLKTAHIINHPGDIVGSSIQLTWRSKTGYHLRHTITITSIEPRHVIRFVSSGDLVGQGSWQLSEENDLTHMAIDWHVQTTKRWMNLLSPILRPIFVRNHAALMKNGESGLNKYLLGS